MLCRIAVRMVDPWFSLTLWHLHLGRDRRRFIWKTFWHTKSKGLRPRRGWWKQTNNTCSTIVQFRLQTADLIDLGSVLDLYDCRLHKSVIPTSPFLYHAIYCKNYVLNTQSLLPDAEISYQLVMNTSKGH